MNWQALFRFMRERHHIYLRREGGFPQREWTKDPILQTYKFTNVYRELDRVTVWLRKAWREPYADHPNLWFAMAMARQINWPDTLEELGFPVKWNPTVAVRMEDAMRARASRGEKVYTGAYMLRCDIQDATTPDKPAYTMQKVLAPLWTVADMGYVGLRMPGPEFFAKLERTPAPERSVQHVHQWFMQHHGWGGFLSYEVVTDLMETRYLREARDRDTWAFAGPGAVRGLNRLLGIDVKAPMPPAAALLYMRTVFMEVSGEWYHEWPDLHLREIEHSLCEFDKYERVRLGQGRPRSRFTPTPQE